VLDPINVEAFISKVFDNTQHSKKVKSIANAALGVIVSAPIFAHRISRGLAKTLNLSNKHAVKQVDRLLSNKKLKLEDTDKSMVSFIVGDRKEVKITMERVNFILQNSVCLRAESFRQRFLS
jgi:predicted nucleotidyltransferase